MLTGSPPVMGRDVNEHVCVIASGGLPTLEGFSYSQAVKNFAALCLRESPDQRPTARSLLTNPFIKKNFKSKQALTLLAQYVETRNSQFKESLPPLLKEDRNEVSFNSSAIFFLLGVALKWNYFLSSLFLERLARCYNQL